MLIKLLLVGLSIACCLSATVEKRSIDILNSKDILDWIDTLIQRRTTSTQSDRYNLSQTVCMTTNTCMSKYIIYLRSGTRIKKVKIVKCPCVGKYNHQCGTDYCSVDSNACNYLEETSVSQKNIQLCN